MANNLVINQGREFTSTAYRRAANRTTVIPIPAGFEARMKFARGAVHLLTLDSPAGGLTIDYALGEIAIYLGATITLPLQPTDNVQWDIEVYDPLLPNVVVFLGRGTAVIRAEVP